MMEPTSGVDAAFSDRLTANGEILKTSEVGLDQDADGVIVSGKTNDA